RFHGRGQVAPERRIQRADPFDHVLQAPLHVDARALDGRSSAAVAPAEADRPGELLRDGTDLRFDAGGTAGVTEPFGLAQLIAQITQAQPVRLLGATNQHGTRVTHRVLDAGQLQHANLPRRLIDQIWEAAETLGVIQVAGPAP